MISAHQCIIITRCWQTLTKATRDVVDVVQYMDNNLEELEEKSIWMKEWNIMQIYMQLVKNIFNSFNPGLERTTTSVHVFSKEKMWKGKHLKKTCSSE
jgi:hypothetical protein